MDTIAIFSFIVHICMLSEVEGLDDDVYLADTYWYSRPGIN